MRLLNTTSLHFTDFFTGNLPKYAILSHTWSQNGEITYQEWLSPTEATWNKTGYRKIYMAAQQARSSGYEWVWCDTNCIDKTSSTELSEAINSMYAWYKASDVCYVFLEDVPPQSERWRTDEDLPDSFRRSRWFTRGWTLQELLAPSAILFFAQDWSYIGTRDDFATQIEQVTGIRAQDVRSEVQQASVARKMAWLATRKTSRVEDMAYCMLGLFDINMPLLYGEGSRAFTRLQEEIIKRNSDPTIFCWSHNDSSPSDWMGLLAPEPTSFITAGQFYLEKPSQASAPWLITNQGLSIHLPILSTPRGVFLVLQGVKIEGDVDNSMVVIPITASPHVSFGHFCQSFPLRGPVLIPDGSSLHYSLHCGPPVADAVRLLLSRVGSSLDSAEQGSIEKVTVTSHLECGDLLLFVDRELLPSARFGDPVWQAAPYLRRQSLHLNGVTAAPMPRAYIEPTGTVKLIDVTVGVRNLLVGALELYSVTSSTGAGVHIRVFLAFELPTDQTRGGKVKGHHCEMIEFITPPPGGDPRRFAGEWASEQTLQDWFQKKLSELLAGKNSQRQPWVVHSPRHFALRILPGLARRTTDASQGLIVVELFQDTRRWPDRKKKKNDEDEKEDFLRRLLPKGPQPDMNLVLWRQSMETFYRAQFGQ